MYQQASQQHSCQETCQRGAQVNYILVWNRASNWLIQSSKAKQYHLTLYNAIFQQWNQTGWKEEFQVHRATLMRESKIKSPTTYHNAIADLEAWGFITYLSNKSRMKPSSIRCNSLVHLVDNMRKSYPPDGQDDVQEMDNIVASCPLDGQDRHKTSDPALSCPGDGHFLKPESIYLASSLVDNKDLFLVEEEPVSYPFNGQHNARRPGDEEKKIEASVYSEEPDLVESEEVEEEEISSSAYKKNIPLAGGTTGFNQFWQLVPESHRDKERICHNIWQNYSDQLQQHVLSHYPAWLEEKLEKAKNKIRYVPRPWTYFDNKLFEEKITASDEKESYDKNTYASYDEYLYFQKVFAMPV